MNYLAHTLLAEPTPHGYAGSLLGDFWRGAPHPAWPPELTRGVLLHRRIDSATDHHPAFAAVRVELPNPLRRYAGIVLDVAFDFVLARQWSLHSAVALRHHVDAVNAALLAVADSPYAPAEFASFARRAAKVDLLASYGEVATIQRALRSLSQRLARENPVAGAWDALEPLLPLLEEALPLLLADLRRVRIPPS